MANVNLAHILRIWDMIIGCLIMFMAIVEFIFIGTYASYYKNFWEAWLLPFYIAWFGFMAFGYSWNWDWLLKYFVFFVSQLGVALYFLYLTFLVFTFWDMKNGAAYNYSWYSIYEIITGSMCALSFIIHFIAHFTGGKVHFSSGKGGGATVEMKTTMNA